MKGWHIPTIFWALSANRYVHTNVTTLNVVTDIHTKRRLNLGGLILFRHQTGPKVCNVRIRVARWYIFKPKIPIWVNFGGSSMDDVGILYVRQFDLFYDILVYCGHLVYFMIVWYIYPILGSLCKRRLLMFQFYFLNQGNWTYETVASTFPVSEFLATFFGNWNGEEFATCSSETRKARPFWW
jgi:hypothetical protein